MRRSEVRPRKPPGQIIERERQTGVFYGLRVRAYGRRYYVGLGAESDGWTRERAQDELAYVSAQIERGVWRPPDRRKCPPEPELPRDQTFHEFASEWFDARRRELRPNTVADYEWRLTHHLLPFFRRHRLSDITVQEVDRYRQAKVREGRLSAESINKTLTLLAQVLEHAVEYELMDRNPAAGRRRRLRTSKPRCSYLDTAGQIAALLDAAGELDAEARCDRQHLNRRAMLATLIFAGLRLGELLALRWRDVDLAGARLRVGEAKTDAGRRDVRMQPALRDELADLKARTKSTRADALVFPSAEGRPIGASNLRRRVLAKAIERANERLSEAGSAPLPEPLTPHSLRRTFASVLYALGENPADVMADLGHTQPGLALAIYAQAMRRDPGERERLRALVEGPGWPAAGFRGGNKAGEPAGSA